MALRATASGARLIRTDSFAPGCSTIAAIDSLGTFVSVGMWVICDAMAPRQRRGSDHAGPLAPGVVF